MNISSPGYPTVTIPLVAPAYTTLIYRRVTTYCEYKKQYNVSYLILFTFIKFILITIKLVFICWFFKAFASLSLANGLYCLTDFCGFVNRVLNDQPVNWPCIRRCNYL